MAFTKESIFSKIGELLVELNDGYTALSESADEVSATSILLLEAKAKFLATHFEVLRQLQDSTVAASEGSGATSTATRETSPAQEVFFTPPIVSEEQVDKQPVEAEIVEEEKPAEDISFEAPKPETTALPEAAVQVEEEPHKEEPRTQNLFNTPAAASAPAAESTTEEVAVEQPENVEETPEKPTAQPEPTVVVNEVIQEPKEIVIENKPAIEEEKPARPLTLNEMLQQQRRAGFAQSPTATPQPVKSQEKVVDLKSVINLNDKLLFIKDLFNGYSLAYSEAIELLNRYSTFAEADVFLQTNYALKNNWADKPQTVEKLYAVLRKKFLY